MTDTTDPPLPGIRSVCVVWSAGKGSRCYDDRDQAVIDSEHYAPPAQVVEYVPLSLLESERSEHAKTMAHHTWHHQEQDKLQAERDAMALKLEKAMAVVEAAENLERNPMSPGAMLRLLENVRILRSAERKEP